MVWHPRQRASPAVTGAVTGKGLACAVFFQAASSWGWHAPHAALPDQSRRAAAARDAPSADRSSAASAALEIEERIADKLLRRAASWYPIGVASAATVIGLTGGIASGKSAVAMLLRQRGASVVDADALARRVVAPGQPALTELVVRFGPEILLPDGQLDRKKLGSIVFADAAARADLDRITHPRIAQLSQQEIAAAAAAGASLVFYEAALLIENGLHRTLDGVLLVAAPLEVQRQRLMQRDGLSREAADARIAAQLPLAAKREAATWIIDNRGDRAELELELERALIDIIARHGPLTRGASSASGARTTSPPAPRVALVTGFPSPVARHLALGLATATPTSEVRLLVAPTQRTLAEQWLAGREPETSARLRLLIGDPAALHLGLASAEYEALRRELTHLHLLAGVGVYAGEPLAMRAALLRSIDTALELAREAPRLARFVYWSSAHVAGPGEGPLLESELAPGPCADARLEALRDAEAIVRGAARDLPTTILRPSQVIASGDEARALPWHDALPRLIERVAAGQPALATEPTWHDWLGGGGEHALVHVVPLEFLVEVARLVTVRADTAGATLHLTDPTPMTAGELWRALAEHCHAPSVGALARLGALVHHWRHRHPSAHEPLPLTSARSYDTRHARAALDALGLVCPTLASYLPALADAVLARPAGSAHGADEDPDDPLA